MFYESFSKYLENSEVQLSRVSEEQKSESGNKSMNITNHIHFMVATW